jgi:hypothetical protein
MREKGSQLHRFLGLHNNLGGFLGMRQEAVDYRAFS